MVLREFSLLKGKSLVVLRHLDFKKVGSSHICALCLNADWNLRQIIKQSRTVGEKVLEIETNIVKTFNVKLRSSGE